MNTDAFILGLGRVSAHAAVLVMLVLVAQRLFRNRLSPRWRCALWMLPALRLVLPVSVSSTVSVFNLTPKWQPSPAERREVVRADSKGFVMAARPGEINASEKASREASREASIPEISSTTNPIVEPIRPSRLSVEKPDAGPVAETVPIIHAVSLSRVLFWTWLAGAGALLTRVLVLSLRYSREFGQAECIQDDRILALFEGAREEMGVKDSIGLFESEWVSSPVLHGCRRPRLILPLGLKEQLSWEEMRFVFLHEMAHVRRRDILQNWLGAILQITHWFNPLVWLAFSRWRADRELACDALALETAGEEKKQDYGRTILRLLEASPGVLGAPAMVGILEDKRQLRERIAMIAAFAPGNRWSFIALVLLAALGAAGLTDSRLAVEAANKIGITDGEEGTRPILELEKAKTALVTNGPAMRVTVVNEAGQPIEGAEIRAPHSAAFFPGSKSGLAWKTDARGLAEIHLGIIPDEPTQQNTWFTMSVRGQGYAPFGLSWAAERDDARHSMPAEVRVVLRKGVRMGGVVQDERGKPLANVRLGINGSEYSYQGGAARHQEYSEYWSDARYAPAAITDASGKWFVDDVPTDLTKLQIRTMRPDGSLWNFTTFEPDANPFNLSGLVKLDIEALRKSEAILTLKDGVTIRGVVRGPDGKAIPDVLIHEVHDKYRADAGLQFRTDAEGRFELRNRTRGQIALIAAVEGYAIQSKIVTIQPETGEVVFNLEKASPLTIQVTDEKEKPVAGAQMRVDALRSEVPYIQEPFTADADGKVVWTNAPFGKVVLIATAPGGKVSRKVRVAANQRSAQVRLRSGMEQEIIVEGKAVDDETGEAVAIKSLKAITEDFTPPVDLGEVSGSTFRVPIKAGLFRQGMYPSFRLQCEAEDHLTWRSEFRDFDEGDWNLEIRLKRGGRPGGTLRLADGTPAEGAEITVAMRENEYLLMNQPGTVWPSERAVRLKADENGKFEFKDPGMDSLVLITHEKGFLETSTLTLQGRPELTLQPWGRVEGVLKVGNKPGANARLMLSSQTTRGKNGWTMIVSGSSGAEGEFSFDKVPPGSRMLYRYFDKSPGPITETYQMPVMVKPGEVTRVTYGGTGRPVIGQVDGTADWKNDVHLLVLKEAGDDDQPRYEDYFNKEEFSKALSAYRQSEGNKARMAQRSYWLNFNEDGSFRIDDVPAGTYELSIKVTEPPRTEQERMGMWNNRKAIASLTREVVVPEIPGGRSDEPLDLGLLELKWSAPQETQPPLAMKARTVEGNPFELEKYRGRFVLLNFWAAWSESSLEQMAEITALKEKYKDDARIAFVGVNLGGDPAAVRKRIESAGYRMDEEALLSGSGLAELTEAVQLDALPSAFLINPAGRIQFRDLKIENLERSLQTALKRNSGKESL